MAKIHVSSPFLKHLTHIDVTVGTTKSQILQPSSNVTEKRIAVIVQNKSSTATVQVIGNSTSNVGLAIAPLSTISLDNYNGSLYAISTAANTTVHIAISAV